MTAGTNTLLGLAPSRIREVSSLLAARDGRPAAPEGWDGYAAERLVDVLEGQRAALSATVPARGSAAR